jgi:hypothetical protein
MNDLQLLTPAELMIQRFGKDKLAEMLGINAHTIYRWTTRTGDIPHEHQRTLIMKYNVNADDLILGGIH